MKISVDNINYEVHVRGEGDPILFIHGFPLDHSMWNGQLDFLSKSYQVIAPDLRGFGMSEITSGTVTMDQFSNDLNKVLISLGITEPVILCGLSMGGYIAWQFLRNHPEKVKSLILCDTRAAADSDEAIANRMNLVKTVLSEGTDPVAAGMIPKLFSEETLKNKQDIVNQLTNTILNTHPKGIAAALKGMAARPDSTSLLAEIQIPALLIVGEEDHLSTPDEMKGMAEQIPNSQFAVIKGAGHMSPMECPDSVNDVISQFLSL